MADILDDRRAATMVEWQTTEWEWVDPQSEQTASQNAIDGLQSTYQSEMGTRGKNWRSVFYQRAKEEKLKRDLGLITPADAMSASMVAAGEQKAGGAELATPEQADASGEMMGLSRLQWSRNRKAIEDVLSELADGAISEAKARVFLSSVGMSTANVDALVADALDGTVDTVLPAEVPSA
jgi:capsid protein